MSAGAVLQLFPSTSPVKTGPKRKGSRRYPVKAQTPEPIIEEVKSSNDGAKGVVIQVIEERAPSPVSVPPKAHVAERSRSNTPTSQLCERRGAASPAPLRAASPADTFQSGHSTSPTLVRSNSAASTTDTRSPLMRSIFPRYNPNLPLAQQRYYPDPARGASPTNLPREVVSKAEYSPSMYSPGSAGKISKHGYAEGPKTAPASVFNFPAGVLDKTIAEYSTMEELAGLWDAANGQSSNENPNSYKLQINRTNSSEPSNESWTFGASASKPFYDLQAHTTSELTIRRHHPQKPSTIIPIAVLDLEPSTRHLPPADGLATLIFPKLAALMAMDQATSTAAKYGLPQSDCESLTSEAVARAESVDACTLCWDAESSTYQLIHPTLANGSPQIFSIVVEGDASLATVTNGKGRIDLLSPTDPTLSLVSLDFASKSLTINAHALTTHHPSLYIVDVSVIAILAVACFESRRSSRDTPIFSAPPTIADVEQVRGIDGWKLGSKSKSNVIQKYTEDKRLPKTTRGVLKVISWTFMVLVWVLTLLVEGLAKVVVGVSKVAEKA